MDSNRFAALALTALLALPAAAYNHVNFVAPTVQGPFTVACSNVAQDASRIAPGLSATDYWEGRNHYVSELFTAPETALQYDVRVPFDPFIYPANFGRHVEFAAFVCHPTPRTNNDPDYVLPGSGDVVPHMQQRGAAPKFVTVGEYVTTAGAGVFPPAGSTNAIAKLPYIVYSHGLGGSPITSGYVDTMVMLASHGFVVGAPFHADPRFSRVRIEDMGDLAYLLVGFNQVVEMQLMRPLSLKALTDRLLADPWYSPGINPDKIGGFGASLGGQAMLHLLGARITSTIGFTCSNAPRDTRIKAAVGFVTYAGQTFLPAFCDSQSGVDSIDTPFMSINGNADTTAPIKLVDSTIRRLKGSRYLIELAGVPHEFRPEYAGDMLTWMVTFLNAYLHVDNTSLDKLVRMRGVFGGPLDTVRLDMHMPDPALKGEGYFVAKEFRNTRLDHYFVSAFPPEIEAVTNGAAGAEWTLTGQAFNVYGPPQSFTTSVCRFFAPVPSSHFYTAIPNECEQVKRGDFGPWVYEGIGFQIRPPDAQETCPPGFIGVNRAYNMGFPRNDSNHRFSVSDSTMRDMEGEGWRYEGTVMCARL